MSSRSVEGHPEAGHDVLKTPQRFFWPRRVWCRRFHIVHTQVDILALRKRAEKIALVRRWHNGDEQCLMAPFHLEGPFMKDIQPLLSNPSQIKPILAPRINRCFLQIRGVRKAMSNRRGNCAASYLRQNPPIPSLFHNASTKLRRYDW